VSAADSSQPDGQLDRSLVAALYEEHEAELRRLLTGILRDHQLAGDVLQITFAKVLTEGHHSQPESRKAWLFRVATNEAFAFLRRRTAGEKMLQTLAWSIGEPGKTGESIESGLVREEAVTAVREAIENLPHDHRLVVRMRIYEDKTFAEIASALNIPLGTALGRMRTALEKLRRHLDGHDLDERDRD
jgi:RNA polymerase sigma-70 factor, ECF subfamily